MKFEFMEPKFEPYEKSNEIIRIGDVTDLYFDILSNSSGENNHANFTSELWGETEVGFNL